MSPKQGLSTSVDAHEWGKDRLMPEDMNYVRTWLPNVDVRQQLLEGLWPLGGVKEPQNMCELDLHPWVRLGPEAPHAP
jgi:hypothetical protein